MIKTQQRDCLSSVASGDCEAGPCRQHHAVLRKQRDYIHRRLAGPAGDTTAAQQGQRSTAQHRTTQRSVQQCTSVKGIDVELQAGVVLDHRQLLPAVGLSRLGGARIVPGDAAAQGRVRAARWCDSGCDAGFVRGRAEGAPLPHKPTRRLRLQCTKSVHCRSRVRHHPPTLPHQTPTPQYIHTWPFGPSNGRPPAQPPHPRSHPTPPLHLPPTPGRLVLKLVQPPVGRGLDRAKRGVRPQHLHHREV